MSEPSSLYARIHISESAKEKFLDSKIADPGKYEDWIGWLKNKSFSGSITLNDINSIKYPQTVVKDFLNEWLGYSRAFGFNEYDQEENTWIISMYEFSENYFEYIQFLHVLRSIQDFKDLNENDFILVHSYIWGDTASDTVIQIEKGSSSILRKIPIMYLEEAVKHFQMREKYLSEMYKD